MIKKTAKIFTSAILCFVLSGCSLFMPWKQTISIKGNPPGATVVLNGNTVSAPGEFRVRRDKNVTIVVTKDGYHPHLAAAGYSLSTCGILDVIGGVIFLIPLFGLLAPGAYSLDNDTFYYVLTPMK